jgi:hypothetical protein
LVASFGGAIRFKLKATTDTRSGQVQQQEQQPQQKK